jgi:hypothetical protein
MNSMGMDPMGGFFFGNTFMIVFFIIFALIIGTFLVVIIKGVSTWNKNNHSPRLKVPAKVIGRREDVRGHRSNHNDIHRNSTSTYYYVTFEFESGDRSEFAVTGQQYGLLVQGDEGELEFQGTRYHNFYRTTP